MVATTPRWISIILSLFIGLGSATGAEETVSADVAENETERITVTLPDSEDVSEAKEVLAEEGSEDLAEAFESMESAEGGMDVADEVYVLDDFVVSSEGDRGYYSANSISATRTNALVKNTPITITVINEQLLEDLNILNDEDLARATASVTRDPDGFSFNQLRIRGFRSLTQRYDLFWREIERDGYNIQRVDIVKGANSLIYGQADPGGQINSVPKMAQHSNNFVNVRGTVGNKEYQRGEIDANYALTDDLAIRVMGVDFSRELDQLYEYVDLQGATLEASYRPTKNTQLRAHIEHINLDQNLAPNMFATTANDNRFARNSIASETDVNPTFTLGAYRNEFVYSPDAVKEIPQGIINDLELNPDYAALIGADPDNVTRADLNTIYGAWDKQDDRYSVTGPDKYNDRQGLITTFDWTQRLTDNLQAKIAVNREDDDREARAREGFSAGRVQSDRALTAGELGRNSDANPNNDLVEPDRIFDPYVNTFWRYQEGTTEANALKATLLWDVELGNGIPLIGDSEHKLLFGADYDRLERDPEIYEQINEGTDLVDDAYFFSSYSFVPAGTVGISDLFKEKLYLNDGFGPDNPSVAYNGRDDLWQLARESELDAQTRSLWFAIQSKFMDGRLRTLAGLRYDDIEVDYFDRRYKISLPKASYENLGYTPETASPTIDDTATFDDFSPTLGALFWITDDIGVFGNYAESIQSPTQVEIDPFGELIPPVYGEGYEYGVRFDMFDGKLNGQITAFYIEKENDNIVNYDFRLGDVITFDKYGDEFPQYFNPNNQRLINDALPGKRLAGDVSRAEGVEVEFYYNPNNNLSFIFSYTYNNLDAIEINPAVNPRFGRIFGLAPHNALLISRYKFNRGPLKGLTIGADQNFRSSSEIGQYYIEDDDNPGTGKWYKIEFDYELVTGAFINYQTKLGSSRDAARLTLALRVNNLFDDTDLINRNKSAFHRQSRQYLLSANLRF